jgi:hypothetical protein
MIRGGSLRGNALGGSQKGADHASILSAFYEFEGLFIVEVGVGASHPEPCRFLTKNTVHDVDHSVEFEKALFSGSAG